MHRDKPALALAALVGLASLGGMVNAVVDPPPPAMERIGLPDRAEVTLLRVSRPLREFARHHDVTSHEELVEMARPFGLIGTWYVVTTREYFNGGIVLPSTLVKRVGLQKAKFDETQAVLSALAGRPMVVPDVRTYGRVSTDYRHVRVLELPDELMPQDPMRILPEMAEPEDVFGGA